ncbi:putative downstream neighbor of Son-like protein, partial [Trifolium medium]|nr:putative downstream neighbor of Son-like protein [Trifolium medium]
ADNGLAADSPQSGGDSGPTIAGNSFPECHIPGKKAPLDLTLKTSMRIVSSASVNW